MEKLSSTKSSSPLIDLTSINAIESLFHDGPKDPFALQILADFTDFFIFNDTARYALTKSAEPKKGERYGTILSVISDIQRRDSDFFTEETVFIDQEINSVYLEDSLKIFYEYAINNRRTIKEFMALHNQKWLKIRSEFVPEKYQGFVYPVNSIIQTSLFKNLRNALEMDDDDICHVFDMILKYSLYGQATGENNYYLAYPMRTAIKIPTLNINKGDFPQVPFRFGPTFVRIIKHLGYDDFMTLLHEARGLVRKKKINKMSPQSVENELLREIASELWLPPNLKDIKQYLDWLSMATKGARLIPEISFYATVGDLAVSVASNFWNKKLPRISNRIKWLHWAFKWDLEDQ